MRKALSKFLAAQWLNVLESVDEALLVMGPTGAIEFMNEEAAALTEHSAALAIGRPAAEILSRNPWLIELIGTARAAPRRAVHRSGSLLHRTGTHTPVQASGTPLREDDGTPVGTLLTLRNLSHQQELEARTRQSDRLSELETLVAGLAHEIRNPLSGMRGAAQLLTTEPSPSQRATECTQIMVEEIDRLDGLMSQLLELSGRPRSTRSPINVHQLIDRVISIEEARAPATAFVRNYDPSLPPVLGDPDRLTQVLINLLRNAVEASPEGVPVIISTRMETTYRVEGENLAARFLSIEVEDQGAGFADEDTERIFAPFFTTKSQGTGLGLAISRRIANEHGGALRARQRPRGGASFLITLPVLVGVNHGA